MPTRPMSKSSIMSSLTLNPSDPSTTHANRICATVVSLDTNSGLILSGLPITQAKMMPPTIRMSRDTTRITSQRGIKWLTLSAR